MSEQITNPESTNKTDSPKKGSWFQTVISIVIGIIVTILTTWYTIYINKEEAERSELERFHKVQENLVSIIEEHIVNKDSIDFISLNRIINNRSLEENLFKKPDIQELLSTAEYNIVNSKHLSFEKKIEYSRILSKQYKNIKHDSLTNLKTIKYSDDYKLLVESINGYNSKDTKEKLDILISKYENDLKETQKINQGKLKDNFTDYLFKSPKTLIIFLCVYITLFFIYYIYRKNKRRKDIIYKTRLEVSEYETRIIKDEIERIISMLEKDDLSDKQRLMLNKELDTLFEKLNKLESYYR